MTKRRLRVRGLGQSVLRGSTKRVCQFLVVGTHHLTLQFADEGLGGCLSSEFGGAGFVIDFPVRHGGLNTHAHQVADQARCQVLTNLRQVHSRSWSCDELVEQSTGIRAAGQQ